ncbi:MAG: STT3 domain-containing protein [Desulfovibrio sp.]
MKATEGSSSEEGAMNRMQTFLADLCPDEEMSNLWLRTVLLALVVYAVSLILRYQELPNLMLPQVRLGDEVIQNTHDSYFWLAGAQGIGRATGSFLSELAAFTSSTFGLNVGMAGIVLPAFVAPLLGVVLFFWGRLLGGPVAGFAAGIMVNLAPGYWARTRLGYYDTDLFTVLIPIVGTLGLGLWLSRHIRNSWLPSWDVHREKVYSVGPLGLLVFAAIVRGGGLIHGYTLSLNKAAFLIAAFLLLVCGRKGVRPKGLVELMLFGLAAFAQVKGVSNWIMLAGAAGLTVAYVYVPRVKERLATNLWTAAAVFGAGMLLCKFDFLYDAIRLNILVYLKPVAAASAGADAASYPSITQSVREAKNADFSQLPWRVMYEGALFWVGIAGAFVLMAIRPVFVLMTPCLGLGIASVYLGLRFSMFAAPAVALGSAVLLYWTIACFMRGKKYEQLVQLAAQLVIVGVVLFHANGFISQYLRPSPIMTAPFASNLKQLHGKVPADSSVWIWWDWGYATQYFSQLETPSDGGKHYGQDIYATALAYTTPSFRQANHMIRYSAMHDHNLGNAWKRWSGERVDALVRELDTNNIKLEKVSPQYIVVSWETLSLGGWISYYGSWNYTKKRGKKYTNMQFAQQMSVDLKKGVLKAKNGNTMAVSSVDYVSKKGYLKRNYPANTGQHYLLNQVMGFQFILGDKAYDSVLRKLLIDNPQDPELKKYFKLIQHTDPVVRIYEVRQDVP